MADIDVVPKKGGAGWIIWVVLALVAVAVVWFVMRGNDQANRQSYVDQGRLAHVPTEVATVPTAQT